MVVTCEVVETINHYKMVKIFWTFHTKRQWGCKALSINCSSLALALSLPLVLVLSSEKNLTLHTGWIFSIISSSLALALSLLLSLPIALTSVITICYHYFTSEKNWALCTKSQWDVKTSIISNSLVLALSLPLSLVLALSLALSLLALALVLLTLELALEIQATWWNFRHLILHRIYCTLFWM